VTSEPNRPSPFSPRARLGSFAYALRGIVTLFKAEHNARIHAAATIAVVAIALVLNVSRVDWCILIVAMAIVWMAEAFNTAIEYVCDLVTSEFHPLVAKAKDVAAGAVLIAAISAASLGALVFVPYWVP
jgi:diacylglycerol kinase (ATP)